MPGPLRLAATQAASGRAGGETLRRRLAVTRRDAVVTLGVIGIIVMIIMSHGEYIMLLK